jgi:hypothetical protein
MTLPSTIPGQETAPTPTAPEATPSQAEPVTVSDGEFSGSRDVEGIAFDLMEMADRDDEPSPAQLREQEAASAAPATPAPAAAATPAAASPSPNPAQPVPPVQQAAPIAEPVPGTIPVAVTPPAGTPVAPTVAAPVVDPAAAAVPPSVAAPVPVAPAATPTPQAAAPDGNPFAQLGQAVRANRAALEAQVAAQQTFTPEQIQEFHEAPEKFLPKLVAKIQLDMVENTFGALAQQIPVAVSSVMAIERESAKLEDAFFGRWPQLQKGNPQHQAVIEHIGRAYVQANPQSTPEQRRVNIGAQAVVALNLIPPAAPQATPQMVAPAAPFSPASNGAAAPVAAKPLEGWELFDQQLASMD